LARFATGVEYSISALTGDGEVLAAIACATDVAARLDCKCLYFGRGRPILDEARSSLTDSQLETMPALRAWSSKMTTF